MTPDGPVVRLSEQQREALRRAMDDKHLTPRPYQVAYLADTCRFIRQRWSRQTGKSWSMALKDVLKAKRTAYGVMQLSASLDLTKELMLKTAMHVEAIEGIDGEIQRAVLEGALTEVIDEEQDGAVTVRYTQTTVTTREGQRIKGRPANPRTARGFTMHVTLDEFAMHKHSDEIWASVYPSISSNDALTLNVGSTPMGKKGKFYDVCMAATRQAGGVWSDHTLSIYDAVRQGLNVNVDELKAGLNDEEAWAQEYLVEFVDEATAFLSYDMIRTCEQPGLSKDLHEEELLGGEVYVGVDIGRRRDLTVIWVLEKVGDVLWTRAVVELKNTKFATQLDLLCHLVDTLDPRRVCIDETGIGMMLAESAKDRYGYRVEPVNFAGDVKQVLAETLKQHFEDRKVRIPVDVATRDDLHKIQKTTTVAGNVRYAGERDANGHADRFWALALAVHACDSKPVTHFTGHKPAGKEHTGKRRIGKVRGVLCCRPRIWLPGMTPVRRAA